MQPRVNFSLQYLVYSAVAGDAAHSDKGAGNNAHAHMGFAGAVEIRLVAGMQMAFVDNNQSFG